jgi:hypothetical protein
MYVAVRQYEGVKNKHELGRHFRESFVPLISGIQGFRGYYLVSAAGGTVLTISIFDHEAGAEESTRMAREWVQKNPDVLPAPTHVVAGEVVGHHMK